MKGHVYYWISPYCKRCEDCGIIQDVLFSTPKYRNVCGKDRTDEPPCLKTNRRRKDEDSDN